MNSDKVTMTREEFRGAYIATTAPMDIPKGTKLFIDRKNGDMLFDQDPTSLTYESVSDVQPALDNLKMTTVKRTTPMTKTEYMAFHEASCQKMIAITKAKNSDYTGGSGDPFANFQQIGGLVQLPNVVEIGFLTRMSDKISRIGSFVTKGALLVKDESVEDTLLDLANYCLLFAGYLRSKRGAK